MTAINWSRNELVEISGEQYRVHSRTKSGNVNLEHVNDNRFVSMSDAELATLWASGELVRLRTFRSKDSARTELMLDRLFVTLPEAVKEEAERRAHYVREYDERRLRKRTKKVLGPLIDEVAERIQDVNKPSPRQLSRWLTNWFDVGSPDLRDVRCLAPRFHLRGNNQKVFDPDVEDIIWDVIEEKWMVNNRDTGQDIHELIQEQAGGLDVEGRDPRYLDVDGKLRLPSLRTIYRRLTKIDKEDLAIGQRGVVEADATCIPVLRGPQASYPLEEVEIDHTLLDVWVVDTETKLPLGRPWITVALDRFSRMPVGMHIGFTPPGAQTVMLCLLNAIRPKDWLRRQHPDIRCDWPCFGKMKTIIVDNGPEFHSRSFHEACLALGIDIQYCPVRKPQYKGKIERWFGRLSRQLLHTIPGTTFSNPRHRGDYDSRKYAVMTLGDLAGTILKWVVDDYSQRLHRGINEVPVDKWNEGVRKRPVSTPARMGDLNVLLSNMVDRKLQRKGIELHGLIYSTQTPEFRRLINRPDIPNKVQVMVNPGDIGHVHVVDWRTGAYIKVPATDFEYADGLRLDYHAIICQRAREKLQAKQRLRSGHLIQTKSELNALYEKLRRAKKLNKRMFNIVKQGPEGLSDVSEVIQPSSVDTANIRGMGDGESGPAQDAPRRKQCVAAPKQQQGTANFAYVEEEDNDDLFFLEHMNSGGIALQGTGHDTEEGDHE